MRSGFSAAIASKEGSSVPMIVGAFVYSPFAHGPTPSPPKASQSDAPTGCTPRASAVSASPQPSATMRFGSDFTVTSPNFVATFTGNAPDDPDAAGWSPVVAPLAQPLSTSSAAVVTARAR